MDTADVIVIVLIAEAAGTGITPTEQSVVEGAILVTTILFCSYVIEWLQLRLPGFERLTREPRLKPVEDGRMLRRNMRRELVTHEELMAQLREQGLEGCAQVKAAYMESDGNISVIKRKDQAALRALSRTRRSSRAPPRSAPRA